MLTNQIEFVQIIDSSQNVVATAEVRDEGEYYGGLVNLDRMPQPLLSQFEEFESIVIGQMFSLLDRIVAEIEPTLFTAIFEDGRKFALEDLQIYPSDLTISFNIDRYFVGAIHELPLRNIDRTSKF
jgi:hypothetical protein